MRYHNITKDDMLNGDGLRVVLWVAGCGHRCEGCHNPITWDPEGGLPFEEKEKQEIFEELSHDYISGITLSGGDPLYCSNVDEITILAREIKQNFPEKTIWLYTGFMWEEISSLEIMKYVDILVDGKFEIDKKDNLLHWKGSSNQRVIDVQKTIEKGDIIYHGNQN